MWLSSLRRLVYGKPRSSQATRSRFRGRRIAPNLEHLESRIVPSTLTVDAGDVNNPTPPAGSFSLIGAINQANTDSLSNIADTIQLTNSTYSFTAADNNTSGANVLPVIAAANLTIVGNGSTLNAAAHGRLFDIASGASVTIQGLTLKAGNASGSQAQGGGLLNNGGKVTMTNVTFRSNAAVGGAGQSAQGGGIYSAGGTVALNNVTFNRGGVQGGVGTAGSGGTGGNAQGGAIYASGATLTLSGGLVENINVLAGNGMAGAASKAAGGNAGVAQGGGVYIKSGSLTLTNGVSVTGNQLNVFSNQFGVGGQGGAGGAGGKGGDAAGGGVYATQSSVMVNGAQISGNAVDAGNGGSGGNGNPAVAGGAGGNGGNAQGGGLFATGGSGVTITGATTTIASNHANAGTGGLGGKGGVLIGAAPPGGAGGVGGEADGGGLYVSGAPLVINGGTSQSAQTVVFNVAAGGVGGVGGQGGFAHVTGIGHQGGTGGIGGVGGSGGQGQGGGLFVTGSGLAVTLGNATTTATFDNNTSTGGRGGLGGRGGFNRLGLGGNGGVGGNGAAGTGGGVSVLGDALTLTNVSMQQNTIAGGPGGQGGNASGGGISGSVGVGGNGGNGAQGQGAGLYVFGSSNATVLNSTLADNSGFGSQGGNGGVGAKSVVNGVGGNGGNGGNAGIIQGGGLYAGSSTVNVLNSTIADNRNENGLQGFGGVGLLTGANGAVGAAQGAGLFATNGSLTLTNDTVAWNFLYLPFGSFVPTDLGAGVYNDTSNTLKMQNTIVALDQLYRNSSPTPSSTPSDLFGNVSTSDHDFIGDGTGSTGLTNGVNGDQVGTDAVPLDPQFTAPAPTQPANGQEPSNNGGLTPTLLLNWGSPAINGGDPSAATAIATAEGFTNSSSATDQRGQPRVIDGTIDIGATETQLILSGSAPATVTAGNTITYTLTVTNNESTAVGVTLTDTTPANTTFQSFTAPTGWTTSTPSVGSTGTVTASIASLAPNTTVTFTLVVTVGASTPGSTVIANTPSITTSATAPGVPFSRSITLDTTVPGATTADITSKVFLLKTPAFRDLDDGANVYAQAVLLINTSGAPITGPVALVFNNLPPGVTVVGATGTFNGSPYIDIVPPSGTWQPGWRNFLLPVIHFNNPNHVKITYTAQIEQGI